MKPWIVFLALLFASTFSSAQTADCALLTHQALELSGFNQSIDHFTDLLSSEEFMQQLRGEESGEEFLSVFKPILVKEFSPELLRNEIQQRMVAHCNPEQMEQTVQKLQTPFVAKMLVLEAATNTPEGQKKLKRYMNIARTAPPTDDRMDALDALDASAGTSEFATDTMIAVMRGMMAGLGAPSDLTEQIQAHRKDLKNQMQNTIEISMSVTYHGVTGPELQQYARELAAQPLKGFYAQVNRSFVELVEERSKAAGQDLKKALVARQN